MIHLLCYESPPFHQYSKQVCGSLFTCGDISKCQGVNLSRLCGEMLLMVAVPGVVTQPGPRDKSSMARTSEDSLSAESSPRITTLKLNREKRCHSVTALYLKYHDTSGHVVCSICVYMHKTDINPSYGPVQL